MKKSRFILFFIISIFISTFLQGYSVKAQEIKFNDPNLEKCIRRALNKLSEELSQKDMDSLISLDLSNSYIKDLTGINYATNLKTINLENNLISNISPLALITNITNLNLSNNKLEDISPLKSLQNLTSLNLRNNNIRLISSLSNLYNLSFLDISSTNCYDLSPLSGLKKLTTLYLHNNRISDISSLKNLTELESLNLSLNNISDISPLNNLSKLIYLNMDVNKISDISNLPNLKNLTFFSAASNSISNIAVIKNYTKLTDLILSNNCLSSLSSIANNISNNTLKSLLYLDIQYNNINLSSETSNINVIRTKILNFLYIQQLNENSLKILYTSPSNNELIDSLTPELDIAFDRSILSDINFDSISLKSNKGQVLIQKQLTSNKIIINPLANLDEATTYTILIPSKSIKGANGEVFNNDFILNFTTEYVNPLSIKSITPANNSASLPIQGKINIEFNKTLTATIDKISLIDSNNNDISCNVLYNNNIIAIIPNINLNYNTQYKLNINTYDFKDLSGHELDKDYNFLFTAESNLQYDFDKNGKLDILDLAIVSQKYNKTAYDKDWDSSFDTNTDGIIDIYDLVKICLNL